MVYGKDKDHKNLPVSPFLPGVCRPLITPGESVALDVNTSSFNEFKLAPAVSVRKNRGKIKVPIIVSSQLTVYLELCPRTNLRTYFRAKWTWMEAIV